MIYIQTRFRALSLSLSLNPCFEKNDALMITSRHCLLIRDISYMLSFYWIMNAGRYLSLCDGLILQGSIKEILTQILIQQQQHQQQQQQWLRLLSYIYISSSLLVVVVSSCGVVLSVIFIRTSAVTHYFKVNFGICSYSSSYSQLVSTARHT